VNNPIVIPVNCIRSNTPVCAYHPRLNEMARWDEIAYPETIGMTKEEKQKWFEKQPWYKKETI